MKLNRTWLVLPLAACIAMPALAENFLKLSPEMRLSRGSFDKGETAENVAASPVKPEEVPAPVLNDAKSAILSCTGSFDQMGNVRFYEWISDRNRQKDLPPNYLVDFSQVQVPANSPACEQGPICTDEGCLFLGYAATDTNQWGQDFDLRVTSAQFGEMKGEDGHKRAEIDVVSNKQDCKASGGVTSERGCERRFSWKSYGLTLLPPSTK